MVTYFGCAIRQVTVKGLGRSKIILFSKSEIDENRDIRAREENIGRSEGSNVEYTLNYSQDDVYVLDVVVYDTPGVQEMNTRKE